MKTKSNLLSLVFLFISLFSFSQIYNADEYKHNANNWSLKGDGENLLIYEPEQSKIWAQFVDDQYFELVGTPNLKMTNGHIYINADKQLRFGTENSSTGQLIIHNATCCYNTYARYKGNLYFTVDGKLQTTLGMQNDGSVTIGTNERYSNSLTDTRGNLLSVYGGILCKSITIDTDVPASDFVFEEDYNLKSLEEIEAYVKEYKHLPGIPSTQDFKENGYNVGEMDDLLLRKIEELTLYLIKINKENETLLKEMELLKSENNY